MVGSRVLASPRRRERLTRWTLVLLPAAALVTLVVVQERRSSSPADEVVPQTLAPAPPPATEPRAIRVTPAVRREVSETVRRFARTALVRRDLAASWPLTSPAMREGVSRAEWLRGEVPIQPYPAAKLGDATWRLEYVDGRSLGIDVTVVPKPRSGGDLVSYVVQVTAHGDGSRRRWLVDYWWPRQVLGTTAGPGEQPGAKGKGRASEARGDRAPDDRLPVFGRSRLSLRWLLVPVALLALLVAIPVFIGVREAVQTRRAEREFRRRRESS